MGDEPHGRRLAFRMYHVLKMRIILALSSAEMSHAEGVHSSPSWRERTMRLMGRPCRGPSDLPSLAKYSSKKACSVQSFLKKYLRQQVYLTQR